MSRPPVEGRFARAQGALGAMVGKEFRELARDRRTLAMMVLLPALLLVVFGYAASFNVHDVPTVVLGPDARQVAGHVPPPLQVVAVDRSGSLAAAREDLTSGAAVVAVVTGGERLVVLLDGTQLFSVQSAENSLLRLARSGELLGHAGAMPALRVLFNPTLSTSAVMVPGLAGLILVFVGTLVTSLGVVRERQSGTLEQLAVMPLRPFDVIAGKILPYLLVAAFDLAAVVGIGVALFRVPFVGNPGVLLLGSALFLVVTLGLGILVSTVSQNQGQAIQLAFMLVLPQVLLSGLIFPVSSMASGVRWISYVLPLTYFVQISRGVMLKGAPLSDLLEPVALLAVLGAVTLGLALARFRSDLVPSRAAVRKAVALTPARKTPR